MNASAGLSIHQQLIALLNRSHARYRVVEHEAVGKCEAVSKIRGTALGQGAKALVCKIKGHGVNQHVLAILAADLQADLARLAEHIGGSKASLASPAEVDSLTACVFGAIPPLVSTRRCGWLPIRSCSSVSRKSPLTPGSLINRSSWIPPTICALLGRNWRLFIASPEPAPAVCSPFPLFYELRGGKIAIGQMPENIILR